MATEIVKTNIYRCLEYCPNCPFKDNGKKIDLVNGRVKELVQMLIHEENSSFNCHKTVYNLDNEMQETEHQELKMCYGAFLLKAKKQVLNLQMKLALSYDIDQELLDILNRKSKK